HELGHSLGLEHPGSYNAGDQRNATYTDDAVYQQDSLQYTIMSYLGADNTGAVHKAGDTTYFGSTALLDDIAAVQRLYGANMTTRTGDTTYGFHTTEKGSAFDIVSADQQVVFSIWDAGGINTLDLSGYEGNQTIDLRAGHFTSAGELTQNISIALGTVMHTGIGGSGNDTICGNDANNVLVGHAGNDRLDGGLGVNAADFTGPTKNYEIVLTAGNSPFVVHDRVGTDGTDWLTSIQDLRFPGETLSTTDFILSRGQFSKDAGFFGDAFNIFHLYIAEENRAPDALGLYYWVARVAQGDKITDISDSFFAQQETSGVYAPTLANDAFVDKVYANLFHHAPDQGGLDYWVNDLVNGTTRGDLVLNIALGATGTDKTIVDNKVKIARSFAQTEGLTNADWARDVMSGVDVTAQSVTEASQKIADYAATAAAAQTAELIVKLIGVPDPAPVA
ncbi:MAG: M10 family metallopeptidase C-terminal domain-containing protein, partial [Reyranella sp.]